MTQKKFEHELATLICQIDPNMTYKQARKMLAESEGAKQYAAMAKAKKRRSWISRLWNWYMVKL